MLAAVIDGAVDGAVVAGALWTLWYQLALALQFDLRPSGWPFAVAALLCVVVGAHRAVAAARPEERIVALDDERPGPARDSTRRLAVRAVLVVVGVVGLVQIVRDRDSLGAVAPAVVVILLVVLLAWPVVAAPTPDAREEEAPGMVSHLVVVAAGLALGALSLFLVRYDADDVYYVNRAAWVAEHGTAHLRDTMFGPGTFPNSYGGGLPTPSIEALQGVAASMLGVEAGTFAYLLYTPVLAAAFVWATWRLVRTWAPRRHLLVLLVAILFVLASGASIIGNYSVGRIWQGKVTAYAVLLPLVWAYLSRAAAGRSRSATVLLLCSGVVFVGLTTSSALLMPVIVGAGLLAALALRSRSLLVGALAFAAAPLVNGLVQAFGPSVIGTQPVGVTGADQVFAIAFGPGTAMVALAVVATALAPGVVRRPAAVVAGAAVVATMATFLPGVIGIADAATGAGPVVWRLAIAAPTWVFVGLLVAAPAPGLAERLRVPERLARPATAGVAAAIAALAAAVCVTGGHWLWSGEVGARLASRPVWKVDAVALADVRAARALDVPPGLWLMPPAQMEALSILTARQHAVVPRIAYLETLDATAQQVSDRRVLFDLVRRHPGPQPSVADVRTALDRLDVSLACVSASAKRAGRVLTEVVGEDLRRIGTMRCHVRDS
ncbi:hypothetical protein SAMN04487968_106168 [Nocardioides terrae]|uniref:Uncharacterized protein n=1 Tax=Nocardioides terrae TaxID=574651 RepID=A0A1I1J320_9ACTN|nr:DUF6077 domain-containing protein [Nocardioides terrae]SFC42947.1 hypothetical protein SAMN04487968_106168 [Nocardioides terrae]